MNLLPEEIIFKILNLRPPRDHITELKTCIAARKHHGKFSHFNLMFFVKHRYRKRGNAYVRSRTNRWRST